MRSSRASRRRIVNDWFLGSLVLAFCGASSALLLPLRSAFGLRLGFMLACIAYAMQCTMLI